MRETTIPLLPCHSLDATLTFYQALGFAVTHRQQSPYLYASVQRGDVELHFSSLKVYGAGKSFGSSLVFVDEIADYRRAFAEGLRRRYGAIPTAGQPRLSRLRPGQTRFFIFDPAGNIIIYIDRAEQWAGYDTDGQERSALALALENANFLRDTYANDAAAAKVLDTALGQHGVTTPLERARALAARAELAVALGDTAAATAARQALGQIGLSAAELAAYRHELQAADDLERWRTQG
jgi:catechol 2,3-dioxygenase-like lactoylglutathione lyase family enzyme